MKTKKDMNNLEIAELLRAAAASYQLLNADKNKFRIIAYEKAADAIEHLSSEAKDVWDEGKLEDVPGVGPSIALHLGEIFKNGKSKHFEELMKGFPAAIFELMALPRIGAKTAFRLVNELGIESVPALEKAAKAGKIATIPGFGVESEAEILKGIEESKNREKRLLLPYATEIASSVIAWLKTCPQVKIVDPLGSLRRKASTVGDIDIAVASNEPGVVLEHFVAFPKAKRTLEKGKTTASILLPGEVQVDLMVQPQEAYGALLQHFTGSKHHNIALREYALKNDLSLSEYGIEEAGKLKKYATEELFYQKLGLEWIPPELREDSGEIEAAKNNALPKLIEITDVKGDLQMHTNFDIETSHDIGESPMEELVERGGELGYQYLAFTDHNPSKSKHTENEILNILKARQAHIDNLNYSIVKHMKSSVKKVFNSLEIDILPTGELAIPEKGFDFLDFALVSIHSSFDLTRANMTKRVISALSHPKSKIFAHPTARKLGVREGVELNWSEIFDFCLKNNKFIEINADPMRLDLPDILVREAIQKGVKLTLGTDSHHKDSLLNMPWGVSVARRGWAQSSDIINCLNLNEIEKMLK
jgi:DNA polymerase (family 10)